MSAATDRNKVAMANGAAVKPKAQNTKAQGAEFDKALSKGFGKKHRSG